MYVVKFIYWLRAYLGFLSENPSKEYQNIDRKVN